MSVKLGLGLYTMICFDCCSNNFVLKLSKTTHGCFFMPLTFMSYLFIYILYLFYISFGIPVIYPKERVCYIHILGAKFLLLKSSYHHENQPVLLAAINLHV